MTAVRKVTLVEKKKKRQLTDGPARNFRRLPDRAEELPEFVVGLGLFRHPDMVQSRTEVLLLRVTQGRMGDKEDVDRRGDCASDRNEPKTTTGPGAPGGPGRRGTPPLSHGSRRCLDDGSRPRPPSGHALSHRLALLTRRASRGRRVLDVASRKKEVERGFDLITVNNSVAPTAPLSLPPVASSVKHRSLP